MTTDHWQYEPAEDLDQTFVQRLARFPREPDMFSYGVRSMAALAIRGYLRLYHRFQIIGRENLPREGSFVMVANHASHLDALCLLSALPLSRLHRTFPAAASDYFFVRSPRMAIAVLAVNALPFQRKAHIRHSMQVCKKLLENPGNVLILFPEGTRSPDGRLGEFRPGVGLLTAGTATPIVPCYLDGAHESLPKGAWLPRPQRIRLLIGTPRQYSSLDRNKHSMEHICQDLRGAVEALANGGAMQPELERACKIGGPA